MIIYSKKNETVILGIMVFVIMLALNFSITNMNFGDDSFFLKQFTHDFKGNYLEFFRFRYNEWTSRLIIEFILTQCVQHVFLWKILNALAMTIIAIVPIHLFRSDDKTRGILVGLGFSLLIPIASINNAGWIATTTNYLWVMAAALLALYPIMNYINNKRNKWITYLISLVMVLYASNQEQMVIMLLIVLSVIISYLLFNKQKIMFVLPYYVIVIVNLIFILTCKGNRARNLVETKQWWEAFNDFTLFEKFQIGYTSTLKTLFFEMSSIMFMFVLLIAVTGVVTKNTNLKKTLSCLPLITYLMCIQFNDTLDLQFDIQSGKIYWKLVVLLTVLIFIYVLGLWGATETKNDFIIVIFILILGVGSRVIVGFAPTIWVSGARTYYFMYVMIILSSVYLVRNFGEKKEKSRYLFLAYLALLSIIIGLTYLKHI